jgi:hypothetical protein
MKLIVSGGFLADPATQYPTIFGKNTFLGGKDGVQWMINYPYLLPNLVSACFLICSAMVIIFGLEEVCSLLFDSTQLTCSDTLHPERQSRLGH